MSELLDYFDHIAKKHTYYKDGAWCYEDGLIYRGLCDLHRATQDDKWLAHLNRLLAKQVDKDASLRGYHVSDYNIDNIQPGRSLLYMYKATNEEHYLRAAERLIDQLRTQPRTKSGVYWHKLRYPWQIWLDGLYMGPPFQIEYGLLKGDDPLVADALVQLERALEQTYVPETGLYAHAFDEARKQPWANKQTGHSQAHWARALGWLAMALVDVADLVSPQKFAPLQDRTINLLSDIVKLRTANGLWLQVIDAPHLQDNFEETSASAMFVYALAKAEKLGLWSGDADKMANQLINASLSTNKDGHTTMGAICHVAGLGMFGNRYRDGTAAYYLSEKCVNDDPKGVGPLMKLGALLHN